MTMTPDQKAALRTAVRANAACADALAAKDCHAIAAIMSAGRTRANTREIGNGTVLEVLGIAAGNALLDFIETNPDLRHVLPLLEQGRLVIGSPVVQATLQSFAANGVLTQANADALSALGKEPDALSAQDVAEALFNPNGSEK